MSAMTAQLHMANFLNDLRRRRSDVHIALDTIASDFTEQQRALLLAHNSHSTSFAPLLHAYNTLYTTRVDLHHTRSTLALQESTAAPLRDTLRDILDVMNRQHEERVELERDNDRMRTALNEAMESIVDGILDMDRQVGLEFFPRPENDFEPFVLPPAPPYVPRSPTPPIAAPSPHYPTNYYDPDFRRASSELSYHTAPAEPKEEEVDQLAPSPIPSPLAYSYSSTFTRQSTPDSISPSRP